MIANIIAAAALMAGVAQAQVTATGTMGVTNPSAAVMNTPVNQTSMARLVSLNSINDFCLFAPPEPNSVIGNTEAYEVAWCLQPRNNARLIPDGTFTAVHFVKTPLYWQIQGLGDLTKLNIAANDMGGELDPHGATGDGNPVGGNVTTNATGTDVSYEEWMNYMSFDQFCLRICIAENSTVSAAEQCQHTLDEMGCNWVMPGDYTDNSFTSCDADAAYPPGLYPIAGGGTSTFAQRYTGTYTADGSVGTFTVGQTVTPSTPFSIPASSNCVTYSTVGNGVNAVAAGATTSASSGASSMASGSMASSMSGSAASAASGASKSAASAGSAVKSAAQSGASAASSAAAKSGASYAHGVSYGSVVGGLASVVAVFAGAGALFL